MAFLDDAVEEEHRESPMSASLPDKVRSGVDWSLEAQADELLRQSRMGTTRVSDKQDFLTQDQLRRRQSREVYNARGIPEHHLYTGLFRRSWNPLAGTRPAGSPIPQQDL